MGRLQVRIVLHICGKARFGFEKREYENIDAIKADLVSEIAKVLPKGVTLSLWADHAQGSEAAEDKEEKQEPPQAEAAKSDALDFKDLSNPTWIAKNAG